MRLKRNIFTTDFFIKRAIEVHKNKYDYSKVKYINLNTKVTIICPIHGDFQQTPSKHLSGQNCPICSGNKKISTNEFIERAKNIHKNKYDYSKSKYVGALKQTIIICPNHGEFKQRCSDHLKGKGCPKCVGKNKTNIEYIEEVNRIHENKYDYSKTKLGLTRNKIIIICPLHGEFQQTANSHLRGNGCPFCVFESNGEKTIKKFLDDNNIKYVRQKTFNGCKRKKKLRFDFYVPSLNTCIEFDGIQHYKSTSRFGGDIGYIKNKINDKIKNIFCENMNIPLYRIKYDDDIIKKLNMIFL